MYYTLWKLLDALFERHIWMDVELIAETRKAILVRFDGRKEWFPKAWIVVIKRKSPVIARAPKAPEAIPISIKISESHWAKKFQ